MSSLSNELLPQGLAGLAADPAAQPNWFRLTHRGAKQIITQFASKGP